MIKETELELVQCTKCNYLSEKRCEIPRFELGLIRKINTWDELAIELNIRENNKKKYDGWAFRGQLSHFPLETGLERACKMTPGMKFTDLTKAERTMIREFTRTYDGQDKQQVIDSKLYCLSLMQHHGAPTRLLDWTYSPYVALYFALQYAHDTLEEIKPFSLWGIDLNWCWVSAARVDSRVSSRRTDKEKQKDETFDPLYIESPNKLVCPENPFYFHPRILAQQGVFLCPSDISVSYQENLLNVIRNGSKTTKVIKFCCRWDKQQRQNAIDDLFYMNIRRSSLFPDLDGYAQSLKYRLVFFRDLQIRLEKSLD